MKMFALMLKILPLLSIYAVSSVSSLPGVTDVDSLVISSTEPSSTNATTEIPKEKEVILPKIYEMRVDTNVTNRFAKTLVTSKVRNLAKSAQEAMFSVVLPEQAYISGFTMEIDGKSYEAYIQEKEEAKQTYDNAVASGQSAAHVAVSARDSNRFTVSVNIEPQSKATFYLKYEELLPRQNEKYEVVINIHPGQPVKKLDVEVHIDESRPLKFVKAPSLRTGNEIAKNDEKLDPLAAIDIVNKTSAVVKFSPDVERQKQLATSLGTTEEHGLSGQFVVQYDVERDPHGGEVLVDGGYFVHFFAPTDLPALPKQVVFVLDTSGSMQGIRLTQLKEAMNSILFELKKDDIFNIVEFGSIVKVWNVEKVEVMYESGEDYYFSPTTEDPEFAFRNKTQQSLPPAYPATEENIKKAEQVVEKLNAFGGTDIESALKIGLELVGNNLKTDDKHQPIIVFLTDGEATVGNTNNEKIIRIVTELNSGRSPVFSLSFGDGADKKFLEKISLKNLGFARHIYEGADASLQLQEFYKEISSPLLSKVTFKYVSNVTEVTKTEFPILFHGSEIVVAGQFNDDALPLDPGFVPFPVVGWGINGPVKLVPVVEKATGGLERLWAYLTLKQILEQRDAAENKSGPTQEALRIALKYSFVSDVSSLVVVKPNSTNAVDTEDASSNNNDGRYPIIASGFPLSLYGKPGSFQAPAASYSGGSAVNYFQSGVVDDIGLIPLRVEAEEDNVYLSTPLVSVASTSTVYTSTSTVPTTPLTSPTSQTAKVDLDAMKSQLPWLSSVLNENGTINISTGTYELGLNETLSDTPECTNAPKKSAGICSLLYKCPQIYPELTDANIYQKHFCELQGYAGVCCPKEEKPSTKKK